MLVVRLNGLFWCAQDGECRYDDTAENDRCGFMDDPNSVIGQGETPDGDAVTDDRANPGVGDSAEDCSDAGGHITAVSGFS